MELGRAFIFVNGEIRNLAVIKDRIQPGDLLVAVDGGLRYLQRLGLQPHILVGDLDSVGLVQIEPLQNAGVKVFRFSRDKDETDLELALQMPEVMEARQILIVAALGGRLDHTLANIGLLTRPALLEKDVRLEDGATEVFFIRSVGVIQGEPGDTVSLLPYHAPAAGIWTEGLKYPLVGETLYPDVARGVSNLLTARRATVHVQSGLLLCVHTRKGEDVL
ncbi:MAG: thiamine diphosphokinase [Anaerolineae bacterium]|nr:thiamine diphosphokinase [Anaerolineae bacterium]